ncbi:MAG: MBL fold metallo-hydrolase [Bdellovibrionales bacterium]|jgi:glyoxylase-like metal-dependent hydrolase (beta-lactamase superfamily II)
MLNKPSISIYVVPVTLLRQNCTIVACTKTNKCAVIDPGGEVDRILAEVERHHLTVEKIWITHGHFDHGGGVLELKQATGAMVEGPHQDDFFWIENIPQNAAQCGLRGMDTFDTDRWLEDGDTVTMGETTWQVLHCPGHTPGHVVFYNKENNFAQVGDVLFKGSIGRADLPHSDPDALINSITKKLWPLGDVSFVAGHGEASTFGEERKNNPFVSDRAMKGR